MKGMRTLSLEARAAPVVLGLERRGESAGGAGRACSAGTFVVRAAAVLMAGPLASDARGAAEPNRWAVLALLGTAQLMVVLDATIVNIALPSAQRALHFSTADREWIVTAYALAFGSLLLLGGKLGDLFGRKWTFIAGLSGFAIVSAIGGLAQNFDMLVSARALQGMFGALLAPSALGLLTVTFAGSPDRPKAFGIFGAIAGGGASVGLVLGGVLTQLLSWRWCLYVNLVIAVPTAIVRAAPPGQPQRSRAVAASTCLACSPHRPDCSRSSTASRTPRPSRGPPQRRSSRWSQARCC